MKQNLLEIIKQATGASNATKGEVIQSLWSGYGEIVRIHLEGAAIDSVILKHVRFPTEADHPYGWHSDLSHSRKVKSYDVEMTWYADYANRCSKDCYVPHCYYSATLADDEHVMVLEDLDDAGFPVRRTEMDRPAVELCLNWIANFHATFLNESPAGLWHTGSYWHLATRPDELSRIGDPALKAAATGIDALLEKCRYKTFVHGDAKIANFCFSSDSRLVAAVDFQYVGGGCGMKDVVYFLGSCLDECLCDAWEQALLDCYFSCLRQAISKQGKAVDVDALELEWRAMFPVAWADFYRFLAGWMPGHWKVNDYSRRLTAQVISQLSTQANMG
ncbi:Ecdysteroid kinase [Mariprofundus ferrinatatus]|uniref:Ecdysteroid kinase n=1 Tax=Mariprofundus ferrinatatus TaxID=1921087 RepID=A0A2K8L6Q0_9PROT|nr:oxidoreductase family protein [Mariprofundus ferrinatatus]ATX81929.1 Ecdysteroid kinase [Mariprofundus ferrinatatus]